MHRTIGYLSKRFAHIHPGEGRKVLLTFLYFFLVITAYYVIKPVSRSLILSDLGHRMVPYVDLICAVLMGPVVTLFARTVDRVSKPVLVSASFWIVTGMMTVFWQLLHWSGSPWVAGAFYVWVSIFSVLVVTLFWLVANDLYRAREAKRLFGFIGSGGILGGIVGSSIAAAGAQVLGTRQLVLLSAALLVGAWAVVRQLWRFGPPAAPAAPTLAAQRHDTFFSNVSDFVRILRSSRYLLLLIAIVGLNKVVTTFVYYQFNPFIEQAFPDVDAKTTFTGVFFGAINLMAFAVQFFCTSWMLRRWGLLSALLVLPLGLLGGGLGLIIAPVFWLAAFTEFYDRSLDYSLNNTAKEVLYLPIDRSVRYKVKPFIDMVVFRTGKGMAAVIGIVLLDWLGMPARWLGALTVPLLGLWIFAVVRIRREYTTTIRTILQARAAHRSPTADRRLVDRDGEGVTPPGPLLRRRPVQDKLALMSRLLGVHAESSHAKALVAGLSQYEALETGSAGGSSSQTEQLKAAIQNHANSLTVRREAIRWLARRPDQETIDYLCSMLVVEEEAALRHEVVRELVRLRLSGRAQHLPVPLLRRQVTREVESYGRAVQVADVYKQHHGIPVSAEDPVLGLLRVITEEAIEQVFRLLMLLYRPEDVQLVYEQLRAPDTYVRADAIEFLDNLVDPAMRRTLVPILDEDRFLTVVEDPPRGRHEPTVAYRVLQEAIWDHNCWLSVTTLCAVGRLRLTPMRGELERAAGHTEPLIATAAKLAIILATVV